MKWFLFRYLNFYFPILYKIIIIIAVFDAGGLLCFTINFLIEAYFFVFIPIDLDTVYFFVEDALEQSRFCRKAVITIFNSAT